MDSTFVILHFVVAVRCIGIHIHSELLSETGGRSGWNPHVLIVASALEGGRTSNATCDQKVVFRSLQHVRVKEPVRRPSKTSSTQISPK
jgi:hypothetical protein